MFVFVDVVVQSTMHNSATKSVNPTKPIVFKKAEDCFFLARLHFFLVLHQDFVFFCCKQRARFLLVFAAKKDRVFVANKAFVKGRVFALFLLQTKVAGFLF